MPALIACLPNADGFEQHHVEFRRVQHMQDIARRSGHSAEMTARCDRSDEDAFVGEVLLHPNPVAQNRTARVRARRIDGEDRDPLTLFPVEPNQPADQCALAGSRRAGDAHHVRVPIVNENLLE